MLGEEGEACAQCGTPLATDQRYCLTCGTARAEPRLDFQRHLSGGDRGGGGTQPPAGGGVQWSPLFVVLAIAALGVTLLLGVLIGRDDGDLTVTEVPATTTTTTGATAPTTTNPTTTVPTTTSPTETEGTVPAPEGGGSGGDGQRDQGSGGVAPGGTD